MSQITHPPTVYYPELGISMPAGSNHSMPRNGGNVFTTRAQEKKREADMANKKYTMEHQISSNPMHTAMYITDKGDKMFLKFDASRPCTQFSTTETRQAQPWSSHRVY